MADLTPVIETMENRYMRAWVQGDSKALRSLTARGFILLMGSKPPMILDSRSFIEAAAERWRVSSYRFGDIYVREVGGLGLFASQIEVKATMDGGDWSGRYWVTDLWKKGRIRRGWRLAQRVVSRVEDDKQVAAAIRSLQLWKSAKP